MRGHTKTLLIGAALLVVLISPSSAAQRDSREPIIDMHLHAIPWTPKIGQAETPQDFTKGWEETRQWLDRYNIVLGLVSGSNEITQHWKRLAPERIQAGVFFPCDHGEVANSRGRKCFGDGASVPDLGWLRTEIKSGRVAFLGEVTSQYLGLKPSDPILEPYFTLAEELDIPVGIHMGLGPWGAIYPDGFCGQMPCAPGYRAALSDPLLLEDVLVRHPRLRIWVMHAGWPMKDQMVSLLFSHPQVYADIAVLGIEKVMPRRVFHDYLCTLVDHGFGKRVMWGSDFGGSAFQESIEAVESAPCLTAEQKRDIFYNNAARFLHLK